MKKILLSFLLLISLSFVSCYPVSNQNINLKKIDHENKLFAHVIEPTVKVCHGSGVIFHCKETYTAKTIYILTAAHVVLKENMLSLTRNDIKTRHPSEFINNKLLVFLYKTQNKESCLANAFMGKYVYANIAQDIAIIKAVVPQHTKIQVASLSNDKLYVGETLYMSGCGMRLTPMISKGIYVGTNKIGLEVFGGYSGGAIFGDSGGPIFNDKLQVVGIISCIRMLKRSATVSYPIYNHASFHIINSEKIKQIINNG